MSSVRGDDETRGAPPTSVDTASALAKLARVLDVGPEEVAFLADVDVVALRELRDDIVDRLNAADGPRLQRIIAASALTPPQLGAVIGEKWFGPVLCARLVGLVDPRRGAQYAGYLSTDFMADITARTDPRVVGPIVGHLSLKTMQKIAMRLMDRGDHLTLSHFVGYVPPEVVAAILEALPDNATVVRIARYVEDLATLDPVVALLPDRRIVDLVRAVEDEDLWVDGLHLFGRLSETQILRIARTIVHLDADRITAALEGFDRHGLWQEGLQLVDHLDSADLATFADALLMVDDELINAAVRVIEQVDGWDVLVRVAVAAGDLDDGVQARLREIVDHLPETASFVAAAERLGHPGLLEQVLSPGGAPATRPSTASPPRGRDERPA
jgi:hypothetical protein